MTWKFTSISFLKEQSVGAKEANKRRPEGPDEWAHAAHVPGRVGPTFWPSELRCRRSFLHRLRFDIKPTIKIVPDALRKGAPPKHRNRDLELQIGGGKLQRGAAGVVSIDISTVSMMKRQ